MLIQNLHLNCAAPTTAVQFAKRKWVDFEDPMLAFDRQFCSKPGLRDAEERKLGNQLSEINDHILALATRVGKHRLSVCKKGSRDPEKNPNVVLQTLVKEIQKGNYGGKFQRHLNMLLDQRASIKATIAEHTGVLIKSKAHQVAMGRGFDKSQGKEFADLCAAAWIGLMNACQRYNIAEANGAKITSYAHWYIIQAVQEEIDRQRKAIPPSTLAIKAEEIYARFSKGKSGEEKTALRNAALRAEGVLGQDNRSLYSRRPLSMETSVGKYGNKKKLIKDILKVKSTNNENGQVVDKLLELLKPREQELMILKYGLKGNLQHTRNETARILGISKYGVRQIHKRALQKLQEKLKG